MESVAFFIIGWSAGVVGLDYGGVEGMLMLVGWRGTGRGGRVHSWIWTQGGCVLV